MLSGNRNFEGRIQSQVRANYLASPPLVVAYALAGQDADRPDDRAARAATRTAQPVYLRDIWPTEREIQETMLSSVKSEMFREQYAHVFDGDERWRSLPIPTGERFEWDDDSTYIRNPPFFEGLTLEPTPPSDIRGARVLAVLGDSVTTDHISPAGSIPADSPAGKYLISKGVAPRDFNSYGARRGNHEVMMRGTFANIRLRNQLAPGTEGGWTTLLPEGEVMTIYDASVRYREARRAADRSSPGKEYGSGSSRDWAAKGTLLLGVKAVIAESFERIHRSNLVNMGVLPLQFRTARTRASLKLTGRESFDIDRHGRVADARAARSRSARPATDGTSPRDHARSRASTRPRSSWRSATAASCRTCCGSSSRRDRRRGVRGSIAGDGATHGCRPPRDQACRRPPRGFDLCGIAPAADLRRAAHSCASGWSAAMPARCSTCTGRPSAARTCGAVLPSARSVIVARHGLQHRRPVLDRRRRSDARAPSRATRGATTTTT